jgi:chromo domain-containing protein 1
VSDSPPTLVHDCIEIFPVGGFVYITDEVFEQKPQLALAIMQAFFANIDRQRLLDGAVSPWQEVHDASVLWRLCVRPELMASLFRQCEEREAELEAGLSDITAVAELYIMLSETNYIEQDSPAQPLSVSSDKFPVMSERRMIAEEEPVGYFKAREQSLEEGNLRMIRYYAGLQSDLRRDYRHFFIVHTDPTADCAKQWKEEIQSIAAVITPEQCVEELSKNELEPGVDLMFDFHERHMVEKKNAKITQIVAAQAMDVESPLVSTSQISLESGEIRPSQ